MTSDEQIVWDTTGPSVVGELVSSFDCSDELVEALVDSTEGAFTQDTYESLVEACQVPTGLVLDLDVVETNSMHSVTLLTPVFFVGAGSGGVDVRTEFEGHVEKRAVAWLPRRGGAYSLTASVSTGEMKNLRVVVKSPVFNLALAFDNVFECLYWKWEKKMNDELEAALLNLLVTLNEDVKNAFRQVFSLIGSFMSSTDFNFEDQIESLEDDIQTVLGEGKLEYVGALHRGLRSLVDNPLKHLLPSHAIQAIEAFQAAKGRLADMPALLSAIDEMIRACEEYVKFVQTVEGAAGVPLQDTTGHIAVFTQITIAAQTFRRDFGSAGTEEWRLLASINESMWSLSMLTRGQSDVPQYSHQQQQTARRRWPLHLSAYRRYSFCPRVGAEHILESGGEWETDLLGMSEGLGGAGFLVGSKGPLVSAQGGNPMQSLVMSVAGAGMQSPLPYSIGGPEKGAEAVEEGALLLKKLMDAGARYVTSENAVHGNFGLQWASLDLSGRMSGRLKGFVPEEMGGDTARRLVSRRKDALRFLRQTKGDLRFSLRMNSDFDAAVSLVRRHHRHSWVSPGLVRIWEKMREEGEFAIFELWGGKRVAEGEGKEAFEWVLLAADYGHFLEGGVFYVATRAIEKIPSETEATKEGNGESALSISNFRRAAPGFMLALVECESLRKQFGCELWDLGGTDESPGMQYKKSLAQVYERPLLQGGMRILRREARAEGRSVEDSRLPPGEPVRSMVREGGVLVENIRESDLFLPWSKRT